MAWSKLVSLELDDEDKIDCGIPIGTGIEKPDYPYGLRISLCDKELKKLGLDIKDASVGDLIDMRCFGVITSLSQNANESGNSERVEIQIEKMAIESEMDE